ncbi:MAG TPA: SRPBCC family protein [Flavobacteriaceae bacterium]|nr:SRPBCC family protein [Flavobacteriaceae bacterium]MCB9213614.1 SRPBCC family protein [Alteromonas sp.]HPF12115.1 SRPBCC family protein [Flavobacteriaceae bacterium]HQU21454.1 SRPBCC family protein [Flavobacteriaceae bacterium]HQU65604.1 SRPBCC family protein [Flavobacteriaceae bacterium]
MELKSRKVTVNKSQESLFHFLKDVKNFETLMPENTSKFEVLRDDAFVFALKGMPEIALEIKEANPSHTLVLGAISDKIPFTLTGHMQALSEATSEIELLFTGDFNPMMAMMIKGPISKFLETLSANLEQL